MIICADDYGMRDDIDRAILMLCEGRKLSAVSCMVIFERCNQVVMEKLIAHREHIDIGLHLCLTEENLWKSDPLMSIKLPSLRNLFSRAVLRQLNRDDIASMIAAQYELFLKKTSRVPDYIDGHLHVHQLPVVVDALIDFINQLPAGKRPYIRNTRFSTTELRRHKLPWVKAAFIGYFGAQSEKRFLAERIATNSGFTGIYNFKHWPHYPDYFPYFMDCLTDKNGILVMHPGLDEAWRKNELVVLQKFSGLINRFQR